MIGSSIDCKTIHGFCSGSKRRVGTCVLAAVFALRTYNVRASLAASNIVPLKGGGGERSEPMGIRFQRRRKRCGRVTPTLTSPFRGRVMWSRRSCERAVEQVDGV